MMERIAPYGRRCCLGIIIFCVITIAPKALAMLFDLSQGKASQQLSYCNLGENHDC